MGSVVVDDGVDVDVAAIAARAQLRLQAAQRLGEESLAPAIGDQGSHLTGELTEVAGEKSFVLPVEAGGAQESRAVEVGADAGLDALEAIHQDQPDCLAGWPAAALQLEIGDEITAVLELADEGAHRREAATRGLVDVAARVLAHEGDGLVEVAKGMRGRDPHAGLAHDRLPEGAIGLESIAVGAAADHLEAVGAQLILQGAVRRGLEQDEAVGASGAHPVELAAPVGRRDDQAVQHLRRRGIRDEDPHVVAVAQEVEIHRAEVHRVADAEHAHATALLARIAGRWYRSLGSWPLKIARSAVEMRALEIAMFQ